MIDRRQAMLGAGTLAAGLAAMPAAAQVTAVSRGDALNPGGVRTAGIRMIPVRGGRYKVWTKTIGEGPVTVLLLHGGPGANHDYLEAFESFLPQAGVRMVYYDQLGGGNSDRPDDAALWTLPQFVEEVEEVRRALELERFVLLGHSWGGILGIDYALKYQQHLAGLVISNMTAGIQSYLKRTQALKDLLGPADRAALDRLEAAGAFDDPAYERLMMEVLYPQVICRLKPWPEPVTRSFGKLNQQIYVGMQGKSEFLVTGNLKDWERWHLLRDIRVRALTVGAEHDEMDPADMARMALLMPNATNLFCPNGSHMAMWDDQAVYFDGLLRWLRGFA